MKFKSVVTCGIDKIVEAYERQFGASERHTFQTKGEEFFQNCEIAFHINNLKAIELVLLRKFCPSVTVLSVLSNGNIFFTKMDNTVFTLKNATNETEAQIFFKHDQLNDFLADHYKYIYTSEHQPKPDLSMDERSFMPVGGMRFEVYARFTGVSILSILDAFPESTLYVPKEKRFLHPGEPEFNNKCVAKFFTNFFNFVENKLSTVDVLTDVTFENCYFQYLQKDTVNIYCTHFVFPYGSISMREVTSSTSLIFNIGKMVCQYGKPINKEKDIIYHFAARIPMELLVIIMGCGDIIYHYTDLKEVVGTNTVIDKEIANRISQTGIIYIAEAITALDTWRLDSLKKLSFEEEQKAVKKHYNRIELYEYIAKGDLIDCMIRGTKEEITDTLNTIESMFPEIATTSIYELIKNKIYSQFQLVNVILDKCK